MKTPDLKHCPFCRYKHPTLHYSGTTGTYKIACPNCQTTFCNDCTAGRDRSEEKTVEAWNRRANDERDRIPG